MVTEKQKLPGRLRSLLEGQLVFVEQTGSGEGLLKDFIEKFSGQGYDISQYQENYKRLRDRK